MRQIMRSGPRTHAHALAGLQEQLPATVAMLRTLYPERTVFAKSSQSSIA